MEFCKLAQPKPTSKVIFVFTSTFTGTAPSTVTTWPIGASPYPSPALISGSMAVCTVWIKVSVGTPNSESRIVSLTVPPVVNFLALPAWYIEESQNCTSGFTSPIIPSYHVVTASEGIISAGAISPFHTRVTFVAPTPGIALVFSR